LTDFKYISSLSSCYNSPTTRRMQMQRSKRSGRTSRWRRCSGPCSSRWPDWCWPGLLTRWPLSRWWGWLRGWGG